MDEEMRRLMRDGGYDAGDTEFWTKELMRRQDALLELLMDTTRVVVVHPDTGRAYDSRGFDGVELHWQDDGQTLKIIPKGEPQ